MLHGTQESRDLPAVIVETDLSFCISPEHLARIVLQQLQEFCRDRKRYRQQFRRFIARIAEHHALVSRAAAINAHRDIETLLANEYTYIKIVSVVAEAILTDTLEDAIHKRRVVRFMGRCNLAGDNDVIILNHNFDSHTCCFVMAEDLCYYRVTDSITDLIRVSV